MNDIKGGIGILLALKEDVSMGLLTHTKQLILAELFDDFIEISKHLLETGYKDPSASLIGAVLEDGLRKISIKHNITVKDTDDIAALNTKLADKNIYKRLKQKQIQAWKGLRDSADHGKFDDFKKEDIEDMISGVERFLSEYL